MNNKLNRFQRICGAIQKVLKHKTLKETQLKFYKVMAVITLLYSLECWMLWKSNLKQLEPSEIKFHGSVKGCSREERLAGIKYSVNNTACRHIYIEMERLFSKNA